MTVLLARSVKVRLTVALPLRSSATISDVRFEIAENPVRRVFWMELVVGVALVSPA